MATKKCMQCGGSTKKMAKGGQALNKAKGFAKAQTGGSNVSNQIYGVPNAGPTGPNRQGIDTMKKGGATKTKKALPKAQDGLDLNWANARPDKKIGALEPTGAKAGVGAVLLGAAGMAAKAIADKIKKIKAKKKAEEEKKKKESATPKSKFGSSVSVQRSPKSGKITGVDGGYAKIGMREPARTKFAKGGFPDLNKDGKVTKADILKGRGVIKKKGGAVKKK